MSPLKPHPVVDPDSVYGTRSIYRCDSLEACDRALSIIARRIRLSTIPDLVEMLKEDADRLLDRRSWLTLPIKEA